jgi:uncharacterized protein (TIGR03000 family)
MGHRWPARIRVVVCIAFLCSASLSLAQQAGQQAQTVTLRVLLPAANAKLTIQNQPTQQSGTERSFVSPPLLPGKEYTYTLSAFWEPNNYTKITRTRTIPVQAGKEIEVDLRQADDNQPDKMLIRYVPTPMEVVEAMLKLGEVAKDDVVFDLGCGDGRIVVTAVQKYGAKRGVGVDIDPERIKDSKATAKQAKVEGKVQFRMEDVLQIKDYSEANVVMLYMGNDLNLALRPILQKTLKPGSRIVSHRFTMGDWKPDKSITVTDGKGTQYKLHLWKIGETKD